METAIIDGTAINTVTTKRPPGILKTPGGGVAAAPPPPTTRDQACQTISTGEIIATQLYHDKK